MNRWIYASAALAAVSWGTGTRPVRAQFAAPQPGARYSVPGRAGAARSIAYAAHQLGGIGRHIVSLETDHAEPMEAILNLMRSADANYIIGGDVLAGRKITARFKNVTLEEALDALADAAGLQYHARGNIIVLTSAFDGPTIKWQTGMNSVPWMSPGQPSGLGSNTPYFGFSPAPGLPLERPDVQNNPPGVPPLSAAPATSVTPATSGVEPKSEPLQTAVFQLKYAPAQETVGLIPRDSPPFSHLTSVEADPRQNALIVTGSEDALASLRALVAQLDVPGRAVPADLPARNVMIKLYLFEKPGSLPQKWFDESKPLPGTSTQLQSIVRSGELMAMVKQVQDAGGKVSSSPIVITQDGRPAEIRIGISEAPVRAGLGSPTSPGSPGLVVFKPDPDAETFTLLPRLESNGSITVTGSLTLQTSLRSPAPELSPGNGTAGELQSSAGPLESIDTNRVAFVQRTRPWETLVIMAPDGAELKNGAGRRILLLVNASVANNRTVDRNGGGPPTAAAKSAARP